MDIRAEVEARHHGHPRLLQQELGDIDGRGQPLAIGGLPAEQPADAGEGGEGPRGMTQRTPGSALSPSTMIRWRRSNSGGHHGDLVLGAGQGLHRRPLGNRRRIGGDLALDIGHGLNELRGPAA